MIPPAPAPSSASSQHNSEPFELPEPPEEASRYALDVLAQQASAVRTAPNGQQESTLNNAAYRMGHLVGAGVISVEDARQGLEAAGADMVAHDARRPWEPGYIRYKVIRAIHQGVQSPDPIQQLIQRSAKQGQQAAVVVPPAPGDNPPFSDQGNAERLIARYANDIRHVPALAPQTDLGHWMVWTGAYWQDDAELSLQEMAKETARSIATETPPVMQIKEGKGGELIEGKNLTLEHAHRTENGTKLAAMIKLARSAPIVQRSHKDFDQQPYLLNVRNGTIDLYDQTLRPPERGDYLTQSAAVAYDPDARCPNWEKFMLECMGGIEHLVLFHQTWAGYSATGDTSEQKLIVHFGDGANGKSTFLDILHTMLGSYATTANINAFMAADQNRGDTPSPSLFKLRGARMVRALETNDKQTLDMAVIKVVTGKDELSVRNLNRPPIEFHPQLKLALATNVLPRIEERDHGAWRRLLAARWPVVFGSDGAPPIDPHIREKLMAELPGILNRVLEGCVRWIEHGLRIPPEVTADTATYKEESDDLGLFIEECLDLVPDGVIPQSELYDVYVAWDTTGRPLGKRRFNAKLARPGITKYKDSGTRSWKGFRYSTAGQEVYARVNQNRHGAWTS